MAVLKDILIVSVLSCGELCEWPMTQSAPQQPFARSEALSPEFFLQHEWAVLSPSRHPQTAADKFPAIARMKMIAARRFNIP
jgi:hypothetical protein